MYREAVFLMFFLSVVGASPATADQTCFSTEDAREHVINHGLVPLQDIVRSARGSERSELISARLCETNGNMVYMIATLGRDGRVIRMTVDARTGNVINHR
jgi:uncharacterized membrane protein YkoI